MLFFLELFLAILLSLNLQVELGTDQAATLLFAQDLLLLFLEVQQLVELLNGSPLVFLSDFTVHLGRCLL